MASPKRKNKVRISRKRFESAKKHLDRLNEINEFAERVRLIDKFDDGSDLYWDFKSSPDAWYSFPSECYNPSIRSLRMKRHAFPWQILPAEEDGSFHVKINPPSWEMEPIVGLDLKSKEERHMFLEILDKIKSVLEHKIEDCGIVFDD